MRNRQRIVKDERLKKLVQKAAPSLDPKILAESVKELTEVFTVEVTAETQGCRPQLGLVLGDVQTQQGHEKDQSYPGHVSWE